MKAIISAALLALALASVPDIGLSAPHRGAAATAGIQKAVFGKTADGKAVDLYTLTNRHGMVVKITTYGGIVTEIHVPDRHGKMGDVVLGFDTLDQYLQGDPYFGAIIGRYANRIAKGRFTLDGKTYNLAVNNGPNSLHGGVKGFDKLVWQGQPMTAAAGPALKLTLLSPNGQEGYPGDLKVTVVYTLTDDNALHIQYTATTDRATPLNLTNHSYFNLVGSGDVLGTVMMINADKYTPVDTTLIPTGQIKSVHGTPLDFTQPTRIGARFDQLKGTDKDNPGGYDHNFVLNSGGKTMALAARAYEPTTGRVLEVYTDQPGIQLYSGNFLDGTLRGIDGVVYDQHDAFCLETQHFPDSVHHPNFPSVILRPGQVFHSTTIYKFSTK